MLQPNSVHTFFVWQHVAFLFCFGIACVIPPWETALNGDWSLFRSCFLLSCKSLLATSALIFNRSHCCVSIIGSSVCRLMEEEKGDWNYRSADNHAMHDYANRNTGRLTSFIADSSDDKHTTHWATVDHDWKFKCYEALTPCSLTLAGSDIIGNVMNETSTSLISARFPVFGKGKQGERDMTVYAWKASQQSMVSRWAFR